MYCAPLLISLILNPVLPPDDRAEKAVNWPSYRGHRASGVADGFPLPVEWSVIQSDSVVWKTTLEGLGHSSPVVWGDRLFATTAVTKGGNDKLKVGLYGDIGSVKDDSEHVWKLICFDKNTGKRLWEREVTQGVPKVKRHPKSSHANSTVATDGSHLVALFGSQGLFCYDMDGKLLWTKQLGVLNSGYYIVPTAQWGFGSSPIIHDGHVIVQCDIQQGSFIASYSLKDGEEKWKTARKEVPTWGTPTIHVSDGRSQVIANGFRHIGGYDVRTGAELWQLQGGGDIPIPTPVVAHDLIFITNAHGGQSPIYAIRTDAEGTLTAAKDGTASEGIAWSVRRGGNYMPTPIAYGDLIYFANDRGILSVYDPIDGRSVYSKRVAKINAGFTASPVAGDGKLYITNEEGDVHVVKAGPKYELLAINALDDTCMTSPAISEGVMYYRTRHHLIAVGNDSSVE